MSIEWDCKLTYAAVLAKFAGAPTLSIVELKTQTWYFIFQVVQVFLITTFTSGAASVASQIVSNPSTAASLLATNLPKASNFYMSYFIVTGLMQAALLLLNIVPFLMLGILAKYFDKTPRKMYKRWMTLAGLGWGSVYPKFTNLGVIALSYSCIAPLVLGFSTIGFALLYLAYRYNFLFVLGLKVDMKGESYSRAMQQLLTGVYLAAFCLIGLFAIGSAKSPSGAGPLVLMVLFVIVLVIFQILVNKALDPLEQYLPLDLLAKNDESVTVAREVEEAKHTGPNESSMQPQAEDEKLSEPWKPVSAPDDQGRKPSFLTRKLKPMVYKFYVENQTLLRRSESEQEVPYYNTEDIDDAYVHPALATRRPLVWLPRDQMGLSRALLEHNREVGLEGTDEGAWVNEKGVVEWDREHPQHAPIFEERKVW